jgi:hypothetical protein
MRRVSGQRRTDGGGPELLGVLVGVKRLIQEKRHPDGAVTGLELLNLIFAVHRPARSMIVSVGAVLQLVELLPELTTECVELALDILDARLQFQR